MMLKEPTEERKFELQKGASLINGKYKVLGKVGEGSNSSVHAVSMIKNQKELIRVIKVQPMNVKEPQIATQVAVLKALKEESSNQQGFTQMYEYGYESNYNYVIVSLLGPNLDQLLRLCSGSFSVKTTMIIALQILDRLESLHQTGYIHGDITPDNFLVGLNTESPFIFMVDFGKSRRFKSRSTGQHITYKQNIQYSYNPVFASINAHNNVQSSRRDDIESMLYLIIYIRLGKLPWARQPDAKRPKYDVSVEQLKKRLTPQMLCHKMPLEIIDLMYYVKSLEFYERPDYDFIRKMFYLCLERQSFDNKVMYDWNSLEEIDFKVYTGEPKIVLRTNKDKDNKDEEDKLSGTGESYHLDKEAPENKSADEDEESSHLCSEN